MQYRIIILVVLSLFPLACATAQPPKTDPFKDEVIILQKQFLELQKLQIETRTRLDESNAALNALAGKVQMLEERQVARMSSQSPDPKAGVASVKKPPSQKKKMVKKAKKKVRRQE